LRVGAGVFYDLNSLLASSGFSTFIGFDTSVKYAGVPFPLTPAQLTLPAVSLTTPYNESVLAFDPNLRLPYTLHWNVALEQRLGRSQTLTTSYVGSLGQDLVTEFQYAPQALGNANFAAGSDADVVSNRGSSSYNSLQVKFQRDIAHGLQALASYTWSHSIDNASSNFLLDELLRASSDFDIRQNFQAAFTYNVPGSYSNPILAGLLKSWGLDSHISVRTGLPFDLVGSNGTDPITQETLNYEPNLVPGQPVYLSGPQLVNGQMINPPGGRVVNINAFSAAPANVNGDTPRNFVRGFGAAQVDMAVRRDFSFTERIKLQFRAEAFNVFNHPQFGAIDGTLTDGNGKFGWASTTLNNEGGALSALYARRSAVASTIAEAAFLTWAQRAIQTEPDEGLNSIGALFRRRSGCAPCPGPDLHHTCYRSTALASPGPRSGSAPLMVETPVPATNSRGTQLAETTCLVCRRLVEMASDR
jgi:hypothetical protein